MLNSFLYFTLVHGIFSILLAGWQFISPILQIYFQQIINISFLKSKLD